jgi:hypothetical protein
VVAAEIRDPGRNINIVTRGGVKTGADAHDQKKESQCWIQKNTQPQQQFDAKKEKETFKEEKKEFLKENEASTSNTAQRYDTPIFYMPQSLDHTYKGEKTEKVSNLKNFLESCFKLLNDKNAMDLFKSMLEKYSIEEGVGTEPKKINQVHRKKRTSREFRLNANIGDFNMGNVILDLGSDVNIFPKKTWEAMGEPTLGYSNIQLKLENQQRVIPIGRLKNTTVDLDGVCTTTDFEVMDMVDESIPFPTLLGIDWAFDNQAIINLKTRKMIFEAGNFRVVAPLDPSDCERYVEPVPDSVLEDDVNQLYRTTAREEDYVNPTADGVLSWRSINSDMSDSDTGVENWQANIA